PALPSDPTRGTGGAPLLDRAEMRRRLVDDRFGPVRGVLRESRMPFAMSMAVVPDAPAMGHGRARTFAETEPVAVLEAYERLGGFPFDIPVLHDVAYREIADTALDPFSLGRYTAEQLDHPACRVTPFDSDTPMDWVRGHDPAGGDPVLVPADVGFYQYEYRFRRARRDRRGRPRPRAAAPSPRHRAA
ncbi:YcaO-like family protein, partial [Streptomonospora algeriensis]